MFRKVSAFLIALTLMMMSFGLFSMANARAGESESLRLRTPLSVAILIQDDLISRVGNELGVTRDFIRSLPTGSRVMVAYITAGTLQGGHRFTKDLIKAPHH